MNKLLNIPELTDEEIENQFPYVQSYCNMCKQEGARFYREYIRKKIKEKNDRTKQNILRRLFGDYDKNAG